MMTIQTMDKACPVGTDATEWKRLPGLTFPELEISGTHLYPIVDSFEWIKRLAPLNLHILQLRIKELKGNNLETEIARSIETAKKYGCRLFINDYWKLAIKHSAYGVHLGQGDLIGADLEKIAGAGLRLGISSHCHFELCKAFSLKPSYVAFGPVFETKLKKMPFPPQGAGRLKFYRSLIDIPLVAIGGITIENSGEVLEAEPDFIAVVRDITQSQNPEERVRQWQELLETCPVK